MADEMEPTIQDTAERAPEAGNGDSVLDYQNLDGGEPDAEVEAHCFSVLSIQKPND